MRFLIAAATVLLLSLPAAASEDIYVGHGVAMHGDLKYGPDFTHFDYVNPDAPKGGDVRRFSVGTFDNLNPYILKACRRPASATYLKL